MRLSAMLGLCLGLMLLAGGCDPVAESKLFREGIGTDLSRPDLAAATRAQDNYIGFICQQAGLDVVRVGDTVRCTDDAIGSRNWALIVQAGMNDIDQRCDAYLGWLDDRRRSRAPILSQISAVSTATTSIMRFTGAEANPLSIAAEAFGLATNTFTNANSRLLLEVNHSTVQSVVVNRRNDYRVNIAPIRIDNRPAAIHALRSYLNICMPFTIEMEINTTITAFQFGGAAALADRALPNSVDTVSAAATPPVIRSTDPLKKPSEVRTNIVNPSGAFERTVSLAEGKAFQNTLCVAPTGDFGPADTNSETRIELKAFNVAQLFPTDAGATDTIATSAQLGYLRKVQKAFPSCEEAKLMNGFEVGIFARFGFPTMRTRIAKVLAANGLSAVGIEAVDAPMDKPLRDAIKELGKKFSPQAPGELDRAFYAWILKQLER